MNHSVPLPLPLLSFFTTTMAKSNVVILGGGGAGAHIARALSAKLDHNRFNLVLVTLADRYIHLPALVRLAVDTPDTKYLEENALVSYDNLFIGGHGTVKIAKVVGIEKGQGQGGVLSLENGETLAFAYLVVATGSKWEGPLADLNVTSTEHFKASLRAWREKFAKANDVVVVGAGAVGLEIAGELRDTYPSKNITIVHNKDLPLSDIYPDKLRKGVSKNWKDRNIQFIFNDGIDEFPTEGVKSVTTHNGKKITADIVVPTRGGRPNTELIQHLGSGVLDENGRARIDRYMRLEGFTDIFIAGDITNFKEAKQVAKYPGHVTVITNNILSLTTGGQPKSEYKGTFEAIFITNGKAHGIGYLAKLWGIMFGKTLVVMAKSKDLFVSRTKGLLGA